MPFAAVNGIQLYYESHGSGPAIVFAHGRGGNHLSWWQQVPFFSGRYRCITIDHREFGQSREVPGGAGRAAFAGDLHGLLDHLDIPAAYLVGQSMGGGTCLGYAIAHPERVMGLVLADTTGSIVEERLLADFRRRAPQLPQSSIERAISAGFRRRDPAKAFLYAQIGALSPPVRETFEQYLTSENGPSVAEASVLKVPTLVLVGNDDIIVTPGLARIVAQLIPGARLEIVGDAGHSVYFERPAEFNKLVADFIASIPNDPRVGAGAGR
jgi:3-oxoadipate enol-lactonase